MRPTLKSILFAGLAAVAGCASPPSETANLPVSPTNIEDKERLIEQNSTLTPKQKQMEIARLKANGGR